VKVNELFRDCIYLKIKFNSKIKVKLFDNISFTTRIYLLLFFS